MNNYKKFTRIHFLAIGLLCLGIILFNWLINPYNVYHSVTIEGINANKPLVTTHLRLAKAMAVEWKIPHNLILGSSTAETGLNPEHPNLEKGTYNLGLGGANIYEVKRYLQHAEAVHPINKVILAVNFFMFNAYLENREDFNDSLLRTGKKNWVSPLTKILFSTLLTYDAIRDSLQTIRQQNKPNAFLSNGQLVLNYREEQVNNLKGYRNNFLYTESFSKEAYFPKPLQTYAFFRSDKKINTFETLQEIIQICEKNNTDLTIVIAPVHVRLLETYKLLGLWPEYEQWQLNMAKIIDDHNNNYPKKPYQLWSFNKVNSITTEKLPEKDDSSSAMKWFWDPEHFKNELGNLILSEITGSQMNLAISNFSSQLSSNNLKQELIKNRAALHDWENNNQLQVEEVSAILR